MKIRGRVEADAAGRGAGAGAGAGADVDVGDAERVEAEAEAEAGEEEAGAASDATTSMLSKPAGLAGECGRVKLRKPCTDTWQVIAASVHADCQWVAIAWVIPATRCCLTCFTR